MSENDDNDRCPVCLEEMPIPVYVEPTSEESTTVVEYGCTRMTCGHALHTECLVESLIHTQGKCICCNIRNTNVMDNRDMTWEQRLNFQQVCLGKLRTVKNSLLVKEGLRDYKAFKKEIHGIHKDFKKKVEDYKASLRKEMNIEQLLTTATKLRRDTKRIFMKELKKSTGIEEAAFSNLSEYQVDRWLFKEQGWYSRAILVRGSRMGFY